MQKATGQISDFRPGQPGALRSCLFLTILTSWTRCGFYLLNFPINLDQSSSLTGIRVALRPYQHELPRVVSSLIPKHPQLCQNLSGPCPHSAPRTQSQVADMPLSSRTQPRPSSPRLGAASVTSVPEQTVPHGHQASTRPGQVQTTHLAPSSRNTGAGRMPTVLVTTDHHLHPVEGPRQQAPLLGVQDTAEGHLPASLGTRSGNLGG